MQAECRAKVSGLDLALDERSRDHIQVGLHLRLRIALQDALLHRLHIAHERAEFVGTAVEPLGEREERLGLHLVGLLEERLRFSGDALDVLRRLRAFALLAGGFRHSVTVSRCVDASHFARTVCRLAR